MNEPFNPEDFDFFFRPDYSPPGGVKFYEKDHESIDKTKEKDWARLNLYLSKDDNFVNVWYGVIESAFVDEVYSETQDFTWSAHNLDETLFRGYINNTFEAQIILKAIQTRVFLPQYLGK